MQHTLVKFLNLVKEAFKFGHLHWQFLMNSTYPIDLTCEDEDESPTVSAAVPPSASTVPHITVPAAKNTQVDLIDLTDSPLPQLGPRKADVLKPSANKITHYFSTSPASPMKKIKTEHTGTIVLDDLTPSPCVKVEQSRSSGASPGPTPVQRFFTAVKAMSTSSTGTSKDSFKTATDGDGTYTSVDRLINTGGLTPSTSFYKSNPSNGSGSNHLTSPPAKAPSPVRSTQQQGIQPFNISESLEAPVPIVTDVRLTLPAALHFTVPPSVSTDEHQQHQHQQQQRLEIDCEMDISPLRPEPEYTPVVSMVTPLAAKENTPLHPAAKRKKVEAAPATAQLVQPAPLPAPAPVKTQATTTAPAPAPLPAPVLVPCAEQIDTVLHSLQSVVGPLAALLEELSPGPGKPSLPTSATSDPHRQHNSLTASVAPGGTIPSAGRARTTKPAADDLLQAKKLQHIQLVLFPSHLFSEKPAEISQTGTVLHIVQETLRKNFNSPGVMSFITRALKDSPPRVYLLLIDAKLKALRDLNAARAESAADAEKSTVSAKCEPEVFGLGKWSYLRALLSRLFHLAEAEERAELPTSHSNHSSGEKAARGSAGAGGGDNYTSSSSTSGVASKSLQRRAKNTQKAVVLGGNLASATDENAPASFSAAPQHQHQHQHGVNRIFPGASKVRTEMDARRVLAEVESAECALGLRILDTWGDYLDNIARFYAHSEKKYALSEVNKDKLYTMCVELTEFSAQVRTSLDVSSIVMGPARKNKSKDMDTIAERDVKRAASKLEDLAARVHNLFATCAASVDENLDFVRDLLDLEAQLETPAQWAAEKDEDPLQYEKYVQELLGKAWPLLDAALRPWTAGTLSKTTVRYSVAQLQGILSRVAQNLNDVEALGVVLSGLEESAALRKSLTNLSRVLGRVLSNTKILMYARAPSAAGMPPLASLLKVGEDSLDIGALVRLSALSDTVDVLLTSQEALSASKKRSDVGALVALVDHMRQQCNIEMTV